MTQLIRLIRVSDGNILSQEQDFKTVLLLLLETLADVNVRCFPLLSSRLSLSLSLSLSVSLSLSPLFVLTAIFQVKRG